MTLRNAELVLIAVAVAVVVIVTGCSDGDAQGRRTATSLPTAEERRGSASPPLATEERRGLTACDVSSSAIGIDVACPENGIPPTIDIAEQRNRRIKRCRTISTLSSNFKVDYGRPLVPDFLIDIICDRTKWYP